MSNKLLPTRYEALIEINAKAEFKSTPSTPFVLARLGSTEPQEGQPSQEIWEASIGTGPNGVGGIVLRKVGDPRSIKAALAEALRKSAAAIDSVDL